MSAVWGTGVMRGKGQRLIKNNHEPEHQKHLGALGAHY